MTKAAIPLSRAAQAALDALVAYYEALGRDRAIDLLVESLESACAQLLSGHGEWLSAPGPYPELVAFGFHWIRQGSYWIAFGDGASGPVVAGLFHVAADIPNRII